ncbi:MAG: mandelate racemase/muconate lactonizing enzyme family protein [Chloroflexota bacterium]
MHTERITTRLLALPLEKPYRSSLGRVIDSVGHVLVQAYSSEGHVGTGYAFLLLDHRMLIPLKSLVDELKDVAIGKDPFAVKSVWRSMIDATRWLGPGGLANFAICAIDVALWDLLGKVTGRPLYMLLGGWREQVPCYRPGFWRSTPTSEFSEEAESHRRQGFRAVKLRLGGESSLEKEIDRVRTAREALGNDIALMVDANQAWSPEAALWIGQRLQEYEIYWLEDPVAYDDLEGRARVAAALDIPIASGEEQYTKPGFLQLIERKAADIFNLDLERVGGITGWLSIASLLEARNLPFAAHLVPEIQCHLISATEKGLTVEFMPWSFPLYGEALKVEAGLIQLPKGPGIGLELDEESIRKYELK